MDEFKLIVLNKFLDFLYSVHKLYIDLTSKVIENILDIKQKQYLKKK